MTSKTAPSSWLHETTPEKEACAWESSDYRPCVRMNRPGKEWRSGEGGESAWSDGGGGFCQREGQPAGGVCVWARTDSPATLHSPAITAPTNSKNFKGGGWIRQGKVIKSKGFNS